MASDPQSSDVIFSQIGRMVIALIAFGWSALLGSCAWHSAADGVRLVVEVFRAK